MDILRFDFHVALQIAIRIVVAFALALPIGYERERDDQSAGVRTFPIVAMAAAAYIGLSQLAMANASAQGSVLQGLVTGIGFIGGGAIVRSADRVRGTATAAGIFATAIIGASVGYGRIEIAVVLSALTYLTLKLAKQLLQGRDEMRGS